jgi:YesN/AraC family two-component response regulator
VWITDVVMPHMSGAELARSLRERFPRLRVMTTSGYPERAGKLDPGVYDAFLAKPFASDDLLWTLSDVIGGDAV